MEKNITLEEAVKHSLKTCADQVQDYKRGKTSLIGLFVGEAMKLSKGKLDPKELLEAVKKALDAIEEKIPNTLDEAIQILVKGNEENLAQIKELPETRFTNMAHHGLGVFIRNNWFLWWNPKMIDIGKVPKEKPKLVEYFNSLGIVHADDISNMILTSFHRHLKGLPLDIQYQVKHYQDYWKEQGFADGIPKEEAPL